MSLGLIKNEGPLRQKRVLPRFPYCFLTFRSLGKGNEKVYEVRDISLSGMQICLKEGEHPFAIGEEVEGQLTLRGEFVALGGIVRWSKTDRLGLEFKSDGQKQRSLEKFLRLEHLIVQMRSLHDYPHGIDLPSNLKYWLRSDGPVEIFVWSYPDGEMSRFQVIALDQFIEWEDGIGPKTGLIVQFRDRETPLMMEDEVVVQVDDSPQSEKLMIAGNVIKLVSDQLLPNDARQFMVRKLSI